MVVALAAAELLWRSIRIAQGKTCSQTHAECITRLRKADRNFCDVLKAIDTSKLFVDTPDEFKEIASWCNAEAHKQVQRATADMLKGYSNMWEEALRSTNAIATRCCHEWQPVMLSLLSKPDFVSNVLGQSTLSQVEPTFAIARNTDSVLEEGALGWQQ